MASKATGSGANKVEEPNPTAEEDGDQMDLEFIKQSGSKVLLSEVGATRHSDVLVTSGGLSSLERGLMPSATKVSVVPPCLVTVSRAW